MFIIKFKAIEIANLRLKVQKSYLTKAFIGIIHKQKLDIET